VGGEGQCGERDLMCSFPCRAERTLEALAAAMSPSLPTLCACRISVRPLGVSHWPLNRTTPLHLLVWIKQMAEAAQHLSAPQGSAGLELLVSASPPCPPLQRNRLWITHAMIWDKGHSQVCAAQLVEQRVARAKQGSVSSTRLGGAVAAWIE